MRPTAGARDDLDAGRGTLSRLASAGLLRPADVVTRGLSMREVSSRHVVHLVEQPVAVAVKRPGWNAPPHALRREQIALEALNERALAIAPRVIAWDPVGQVLVTELVQGERLADTALGTGSVDVARAHRLGAALGELHALSAPADLGDDPPDVLLLHRPTTATLVRLSRGQIELVRRLQSSREGSEGLDAAAEAWTPDAFIHGDLRWSNVILDDGDGEEGPRVCLVDWELAGAGDPCWDVGACLAAQASDWLLSIPSGPGRDPERLAARARVPLESVQPSMSELWGTWVEATRLTAKDAAAARRRAARLAGARLIEIALALAGNSAWLPPASVLHAQVGINALARPDDAADLLFGL